MGIVGSFINGAITGSVGLGIVSWFVATKVGTESSDDMAGED